MSTHKPELQCADHQTRRVDCTIQWLLEMRRDVHPYTLNNLMKMFICGKEAFEAIKEDIHNAKGSVDLICWGFDPGMELVRPDGASQWPRGVTYGDLLVAVAAGKFNEGKPVKVRLLAWYNGYATNAKMNNLIGHTGWVPNFSFANEADLIGLSLTPGVPLVGKRRTQARESLRKDYCIQWWKNALAGKFKNLEIRFREGDRDAVLKSLYGVDPLNREKIPPSDKAGELGVVTEKYLLEECPSHHQKPILIDYAHGKGESAIGYVMGLNSITDYWDTENHDFDDLRRERDFDRKTEAAKASPEVRTLDPYRDYACRLQGDVLFDLNKNFEQAWNKAQRKTPHPERLLARPRLPAVPQCPPSNDRKVFRGQAQIIRTQPDAPTGPDKTIKEIYMHVSMTAKHYLYVENQYLFYQEWADHLKEYRKKFSNGEKKADLCIQQSDVLHVFLVVPSPESEGYIPRMYDTAKSLGLGDSVLPAQHKQMDEQIKKYDATAFKRISALTGKEVEVGGYLSDIAISAREVEAAKRDLSTGELEDFNLKVLMARPVSYNPAFKKSKGQPAYRQIYVHSKLLIADDAFMTVGSANLNQRSMAADSEINVATDCHDLAADLRTRVWSGLMKSDELVANGGLKEMGKVFEDWMKLLKSNGKEYGRKQEISGKLIPFLETRTCSYRIG